MGPVNSPPTPVAYRERDLRPVGPLEKGVEILGTGQVYWGVSYADALLKAKQDGHRI